MSKNINKHKRNLAIATNIFQQQCQLDLQHNHYIVKNLEQQFNSKSMKIKNNKQLNKLKIQAAIRIENIMKSFIIRSEYHGFYNIQIIKQKTKTLSLNNQFNQKIFYQNKQKQDSNKKRKISKQTVKNQNNHAINNHYFNIQNSKLKKQKSNSSFKLFQNKSYLQQFAQKSEIDKNRNYSYLTNDKYLFSKTKENLNFSNKQQIYSVNLYHKQTESIERCSKIANQIKKLIDQIFIIKQTVKNVQSLALNVKSIFINDNFEFSQVQAHILKIASLQDQINILRKQLDNQKRKNILKNIKIKQSQQKISKKNQVQIAQYQLQFPIIQFGKKQCIQYGNQNVKRNNRYKTQSSQSVFSHHRLKTQRSEIKSNRIKQKIIGKSLNDKQIVNKISYDLHLKQKQFQQETPMKQNQFQNKSKSRERTIKKQGKYLVTELSQQIINKNDLYKEEEQNKRLRPFRSTYFTQKFNNQSKIFNGKLIKQRCFGGYQSNSKPQNSDQIKNQQKEDLSIYLLKQKQKNRDCKCQFFP